MNEGVNKPNSLTGNTRGQIRDRIETQVKAYRKRKMTLSSVINATWVFCVETIHN